MQETYETWVRSLGQEDPLEEGMATHSSILAWRIPWTEEPEGLQSMGLQRGRHDLSDLTHTRVYLNHFAAHLKLIRHCKSTIFQENCFKTLGPNNISIYVLKK